MLTLLASASPADAKPIRSYFDPPHPATIPDCPLGESVPVYDREATFRALLEITSAGKVKRVAPLIPDQETLVAPLRAWMKSVPFHPARRAGKKSAGVTLVDIRVVPGYPRVFLTFPVDSTGIVTDYELLTATLRANRTEPARVATFPWYWSPVKGKDTLEVPPSVLIKVTLDPTGIPREISPVRSTIEGFTTQLVAAATHATYGPASSNKRPVLSEGFLFVRFIPGNNYPTFPYPYPDSNLRIQEEVQLLFLPDTTGLISGPVPKFASGDRFVDADIPKVNDTITLFVQFAETGRGGVLRHDPCPEGVSLWLRNLFKRIDFYPAMRSDFSAAPFTGRIVAIFEADGSARFKYTWLDPVR